jgi:hypothetical protein
MVRERIHSLHRDLAERLAAETDQRRIAALLAKETDAMFTEIADGIDHAAEDDGIDMTAEEVELELAAAEDADTDAA